MIPRDNTRKTFTVMHYTVFEHLDALSIAFLVCIILYIDGKQFRCSVFTFVQYTFIGLGYYVKIFVFVSLHFINNVYLYFTVHQRLVISMMMTLSISWYIGVLVHGPFTIQLT